jgi:hypothetical protein
MMFGYDATGDEQAEAAPAAVGALLAADKWLENPLHVGLRDSSAIVANLYCGSILVRANAYFDGAILYRIFDGIVY